MQHAQLVSPAAEHHFGERTRRLLGVFKKGGVSHENGSR